MSISSRTCLLFISLQLATIISCQEVAKRTPTGFVGMRGKKYFGSGETDHFYKRRPQFFVGVKGKKSILDYESDYNKRAPMGFVGMRGKKDDYEDYYPELKRAPMGFVGMRGKKYIDQSNYMDSFEYVPKRASLIGQIDYSPNESMVKEPIAFPLLSRLLNKYLQQLEDDDDTIKTPSTFTNETDLSVSEQSQENTEIEKRATHLKQFYGVRGKKSLQAKRPFDLSFRGKFIGVRGKKDLKNSGMHEVKFLLDNNGPWAKRKGQMSGFFGMRGKKWTEDSSLEMEYPN